MYICSFFTWVRSHSNICQSFTVIFILGNGHRRPFVSTADVHPLFALSQNMYTNAQIWRQEIEARGNVVVVGNGDDCDKVYGKHEIDKINYAHRTRTA